jgi:PAS domain S-box-containing protein
MPGWRQHTGQTAEEITGSGWLAAVHPDHHDRVQETWANAVRTKSAYECEYPILSPEGARKEILARALPLIENGEIVEWVGTSTDVTAQRRGEERLKRETRTVQTLSRNFALLANVSESLSASLDTRQIAERLVTLVTSDLADWAVVHLVGESRDVELLALRHPEPRTQARLTKLVNQIPVKQGADDGVGKVLRTGRPDLITALSEEILAANAETPEQLRVLQSLPMKSVLVVPLAARGHVLGTLSLVRETSEAFAHTEYGLAEEIGRRAGMALDNARLYQRERLAALTLQKGLLPQALPTLPGAVCAARYVPGAAGTEVGGDWYDVIPLSSDVAVYVVGDVMGRGVAAASIMGQLRSAVRAYSLDGHSPAEILKRVDRMVNTLDDPPLTTCVIGRYNGRDRHLEIATAGHLPPVLVYASGAPEVISLDPGLPLGVGGATFSEKSMRLDIGSNLLLFTDGLVEHPDQTVEEGFDMLTEVATEAVRDGSSVEQIADAILKHMRRGGDQDDDDTALLILSISEFGDLDVPSIQLESEFCFPPVPTAAADARSKVAEVLTMWQMEEVIDTATLLVSELVTNAVRHARSDVKVTVALEGDRLRTGIWDENVEPIPSPAVPTPGQTIEDLAEGGRGLLLVQAMADNWGSETTADGKCVWFELQTQSRDGS